MKQDMAEYLNALVSDDLDIFELIISLQYRKFVRFYKLVSQYSYLIEKIKYTFTDPSSLDIVLCMEKGTDMKSVRQDLATSMEENGYKGRVRAQKRNIYMSIVLKEK